MAYPNIPNGFALVKHRHTTTAGRNEAMVIYGVTIGGTPTANGIALEAGTKWKANVIPILNSAIRFTETDVIANIGGVLSPGVDTTQAANGGKVGTLQPINACPLVRKTTGLVGKHFRGRMYLPGTTQGDTDSTGSNLTNTALTAYQTAMTNFFNALTPGTMILNMVLLHRLTSVAPTSVTSLSVMQLYAAQRRRLRRAAHR